MTVPHAQKPVVVVQRVLPHYRVRAFEQLAGAIGRPLAVVHGESLERLRLVSARLDASVRDVVLPQHELPLPGGAGPVVVAPGLPLVVARLKPAVLLLEGMSNIVNDVLLAPLLRKTPYVWWTLGEVPGQSVSRYRSVALHLERRFIRGAAVCVGYSSNAVHWLEQNGACSAVAAVNSVANLSHPAGELREIKRDLYSRGRRPHVLFVGRLIPAKRVEDLLIASHRLMELHPHRLTIVGDGPARVGLERRARDLGHEVEFVGAQSEPFTKYRDAWCLVLPGSGGLALQEAMANGVPVICSRGDGTEDDYLVRGGGWRFEAGDVADLEAALRMALDPSAASQASMNAIATVDDGTSLDGMVRTLVGALESAAQPFSLDPD